MATTPFDFLPRKFFAARMLGPCGGVFLLGALTLGVIVDRPMTAVDGVRTPSAQVSVLQGASSVYSGFLGSLFHIPGFCVTGKTVNDFQGKQCTDYWTKIFTEGALCFLPFLAAFGFYFVAFDLMRIFYRNSGKKISSGQALFAGMVTNPALAPPDFFSWFFCLRAVGIQQKDGKQIKVYVPLSVDVPSPGQTLAIFNAGKFFGEKRHVAVLYAPHVAVFAGVR